MGSNQFIAGTDVKTRLRFDAVELVALLGTLILGVAASDVIQAVVTNIVLLVPIGGILARTPRIHFVTSLSQAEAGPSPSCS